MRDSALSIIYLNLLDFGGQLLDSSSKTKGSSCQACCEILNETWLIILMIINNLQLFVLGAVHEDAQEATSIENAKWPSTLSD